MSRADPRTPTATEPRFTRSWRGHAHRDRSIMSSSTASTHSSGCSRSRFRPRPTTTFSGLVDTRPPRRRLNPDGDMRVARRSYLYASPKQEEGQGREVRGESVEEVRGFSPIVRTDWQLPAGSIATV